MNQQTNRRYGFLTSTRIRRYGCFFAVILVLNLLPGCATVKTAISEATFSLHEIAGLTPEQDSWDGAPSDMEEEILTACGIHLDLAWQLLEGEAIPALCWLQSLIRASHCLRTLESLRRPARQGKSMTADALSLD